MKNNFYYIIILTVALSGACTNDFMPENAVTGKVPLCITSTSVESVSTRGAYDNTVTTLLKEGAIGVYVKGSGYSAENVRYNYATPAWNAQDTNEAIYLHADTATLFAYGPYDSSLVIDSLYMEPKEYAETNDFCSAFASRISNASPGKALTLKHLYSRFTFIITRDSSYVNKGKIEELGFYGPGIMASAKADFSSYTAASITKKVAATAALPLKFNPNVVSMALNDTIKRSYLMIPSATTDFTGATTFMLKVDGYTLIALLPAKTPAEGGVNQLTAGTNYRVHVLLKSIGALISGISVNDWDSVAVTDKVELIVKKQGVKVAGLRWAPGNLICSGGTYSFAPTQEYYSGTWNGGDYFCWNTLDPKVINSTNATNIYSSSTDPCSKVFPVDTWRMPTGDELAALINSGSVYTTKNGVNGRYFGTATIPLGQFENNYVFLPSAGMRNYTATDMQYLGVGGNYWSATSLDTVYVHFLSFGEGSAELVNHDRSFGFTIRCVSDQ